MTRCFDCDDKQSFLYLLVNRTIFAGIARHNYVDPDYAYTDDQMEAIRRHKQFYIDFIESLSSGKRNKLSTS